MITQEEASALERVRRGVSGLLWYGTIEDLGFNELAEIRDGKRRWSEAVTHILDVDGIPIGITIDEPATESQPWPDKSEWEFGVYRAEQVTTTTYKRV